MIRTSKREILKLFDTSRSSCFQGGKLEDWNSVCALLFERYRGRWNGWLMTSWAVHTIRAHDRFRYSSTRSVLVYTLARNLKHSTGPRRNTCKRYVPHRCSFFFSLSLSLSLSSKATSRSVKVVFTPERSSKFQNKGFPTFACLAFALLDIWWTRARWIWELVDERFFRK